jgi:hypothetical protein
LRWLFDRQVRPQSGVSTIGIAFAAQWGKVDNVILFKAANKLAGGKVSSATRTRFRLVEDKPLRFPLRFPRRYSLLVCFPHAATFMVIPR